MTHSYVTFLIHMCDISAVPIRIPNQKQKQSSLSGVFCQISFIPNHFLQNRNRNRFVPVTFEFVTIRDQNVTKSVLLKNKTGTNSHALSVH